MKTLITAVLASTFCLGAFAAAHAEKGASGAMGKPAATAGKGAETAASGAAHKDMKKDMKKAASAPKA
jgi:hypothetical protein